MSDFAVLGSPIAHSLSPVLHQAAFGVQQLDHSYRKFDVSELSSFSNLDAFQGLSLTMPLKRQGFELAAKHDESASRTGACNTLLRQDSRWFGFNTDVFGLQMALAKSDRSRVLILGSGATAFSAVAALNPLETTLEIRARNPKTKLQLVSFAQKLGFIVTNSSSSAITLVIATTDPSDSQVPEEVELFDAIYATGNIRFEKHPGPKISGLEMLLWQAVAQQRIFLTGDGENKLPTEQNVIDAMRKALNHAVGE